MVLLHDIIKILCLSQLNAGLIVGVVLFYRRGVGSTFVDGDLLRRAALVDGLSKKTGSRLAVSLGSEEKFNSVPRFVDISIQIFPLTLDADIRLVHMPVHPHWALALPEDLIQQLRVF